MSYLGLYLITVMDNVVELSNIAFFLTLILLGAGIISWAVTLDDEEDHKKVSDVLNKIKKFAIIIITLVILIPSSKQMAFIYIAPQIIENGAVKETVKNIPELTQLGTEYLKELLKDKTEELGEK